MKTQMYNSETLGEDTHMTFQIRKFTKGKIILCEDAFFFVDPIESLDKLYIQRQRWQRSEMEISKMFSEFYTNRISGFITKFTMRVLISDHTLTFSKLLWLFAMIYLYFINYSLIFLIGGNILLYLIYSLNSFIYLKVSSLYLKEQPELKKYMNRKWYICLLMPIYRTITFFIRIAGIINSMTTKSKWHTKTLTQEIKDMKKFIKNSLHIK
jgi:putative glycosyltransferase (exosortase G-associated)